MSKKTIKTIIIIVILFLTGAAAVLGIRTVKNYLGGAEAGEKPLNVQVQAESTSATITWQTDKAVLSTIEYGTNQSNLLLRAPETQPATLHRVTLAPLKANTVYYFRIRVGEMLYDNGGIAYSFRTKPKGGTTTLAPSPSPQVTLQPTLRPTSGAATASGTLVQTCSQADFETKMGSSDPAYDFDKNGVVNTRDWLECLRRNP